MDSSPSRISELSPCIGRERSLERDRYEESSRVTGEEMIKSSEAAKVCSMHCHVLAEIMLLL